MSENRKNVYYIDLKAAGTREEFHEALSNELPLPEYYGRNLDALYDVLTESGDSWNMIFYNCTGFENAQPEYFIKLKKMLKHAEDECENLRIRFFP